MFRKIKTIANKLLPIGVLVAILIIILVSVDFYQKAQQKEGLSENLLLKAPKEKIIDYKIISSNDQGKKENSNTIIKYRYISNQKVPVGNYQGLTEDISKRTNNSQTFLKAVEPLNDKYHLERYVGRFYSSQTFQKTGDDWYYVETATTTPTAFASQTKLTLLDQVKELFGQKALADALAPYAGAGDGYVHNFVDGHNWDQTHDAATGSSSDNTGSTAKTKSTVDITGDISIDRIFLPFDTSAISADTVIDSASLSVYVTVISNLDNEGDYPLGNDFIRVVQTSQANSASLTTADFDQCGAIDNPTAGATDIDISNMTVSAHNTFTLNSTGYDWIKRSGEVSNCGSTAGVTCLGLREGHDVVDGEIDFAGNSVTISTSEETGYTQDPFLIVFFTATVPNIVKIDGGVIKIDGGIIKID